MRIFLDANVLISAAKSDGAVPRLLKLLVEAGHERWTDGYVLEEVRRNLITKAPAAVPALATLLERVHLAATQPHPAALQAKLTVPEKDRPVLAAAIRLHCEALVAGDRIHFGALYSKAVSGVTIHSPSSL